VAVKWVQGRLAQSAPQCARELSVFLLGGDERNVTSLCSPQAFAWLDTMVSLIDRNAPDLIPDGQFAAHTAAIVNLTAGLTDTATVNVRYDEFGAAELPALGVRVDAGLGAAGRSASVSLVAPGPSTTVTALTAHGCPTLETVPAPTASADPAPTGPQQVGHVVDRWAAEGRALAPDRVRPGAAVAEGALAELLGAASIPTSIDGNYGVTEEIRNDSTFDHLSLLSVRNPERFAAIATAATDGADRLSRRIVGHAYYIEERYVDAADAYAELLLADVEDLDLWRDYCWAMRHGGFEEFTRCWVMHPLEVTAVARAVAFDDVSGGPRQVIARFLEWVSDDLG
jgi:hypothetical protein